MNLPSDTNASNAIAVQHLIQLPTLSLKPEVTFYVQFFNYLLHQTEITHSLAPIYQCIFSVSSLPCPWLASPPLSIILNTCSSHSLPHTLIQGGSFRDWSEKPSSLYKSSWFFIPYSFCLLFWTIWEETRGFLIICTAPSGAKSWSLPGHYFSTNSTYYLPIIRTGNEQTDFKLKIT